MAFSPTGEGSSKPPDNSTQPQRTSFKDKLMGGANVSPPKKFEDLIDNGKMKVVYVNDNPLLPKIVVERTVIENMCSPWKDALVVSLLGKRLGYKLMKSKLTSLWRLSGEFDLMDVDNGFYMVKFDRDEDKEKVMGGGPWMIFDHYLAVATWSPEFISPAARVKKTLAWIRIPGLNVVFYDESYLMSAARAIGRPVKLDKSTLRAERGRFARICVELDLDKPVVGKICLENFWYKIEYEGLHVICTKCGCYGHRYRECAGPVISEPNGSGKKAAGGAPQTKEAVAQADDKVGSMDCQFTENTLNEEAVTEAGPRGGMSIDEAIQVEKPEIITNEEVEEAPLGQWMTVVKRKIINKIKPKESMEKAPAAEKNHGRQNKNGKQNNGGAIKGNDSTKKQDIIIGRNQGKVKSIKEWTKSNDEKGVAAVGNNGKGIFQFESNSGPTNVLLINKKNKKRRTRAFDWERGEVDPVSAINSVNQGPLRILGRHDDTKTVGAEMFDQVNDHVTDVEDVQGATIIISNE